MSLVRRGKALPVAAAAAPPEPHNTQRVRQEPGAAAAAVQGKETAQRRQVHRTVRALADAGPNVRACSDLQLEVDDPDHKQAAGQRNLHIAAVRLVEAVDRRLSTRTAVLHADPGSRKGSAAVVQVQC